MLKYLTLPHISVYKRRWVRRIMIFVTLLPEILMACGHATKCVISGAYTWWHLPPVEELIAPVHEGEAEWDED